MDKGISNFPEEIYFEGKRFRKKNGIQIKRMFSISLKDLNHLQLERDGPWNG